MRICDETARDSRNARWGAGFHRDSDRLRAQPLKNAEGSSRVHSREEIGFTTAITQRHRKENPAFVAASGMMRA